MVVISFVIGLMVYKTGMFCGKAHSLKPELHSEIEEVDARFIPHVKVAVLDGSAKIFV